MFRKGVFRGLSDSEGRGRYRKMQRNRRIREREKVMALETERLITLEPLKTEDREQFIKDNQEAFNYGALEEFGRRDDHFEEDEQIISRDTIIKSIEGGDAYLIMQHGVRLPFIYVGEGRFSNERKQEKIDSTTGKENITYLYDIPMQEELPDYLQYDFGVVV